MNLEDFILFNPQADKGSTIPKLPGNYIVTIRDIKALPTLGHKIVTLKFRGQEIIYTGISKTSLYNRVWQSHISGQAGRSTLRRTLGYLLGYTPIPRDKNNPNNGKIRFNANDEKALKKWIKENLVFHYLPNDTPGILEAELIRTLNPPLNLDENHNPINQEFRVELSILRNKKPWMNS